MVFLIISIKYKGSSDDFGYLLHKNPRRPQKFEFNYGNVYIFFTELGSSKAAVSIMLDIESVGLAKKEGDLIVYLIMLMIGPMSPHPL